MPTFKYWMERGQLEPSNSAHLHEVPRLEEIMVRFRGAKYFTALDFNDGFMQVPLAEKSRDYCTFLIGQKPVRPTRVIYGTTDPMQAFIATLQEVFKRKETCVGYGCERPLTSVQFEDPETLMSLFVDDVLIYTKTLDEPREKLNWVLKRIHDVNTTLNFDKCEFYQTKIKYLGFEVSRQGIEPNREKIEDIQRFPIPQNRKLLQSFLGTINFFR